MWALKKARELECTKNFKASTWWVTAFKRSHRIVGRKITKFVSKKDVMDKEAIEESALDFVIDTMPLIEEFGRENNVGVPALQPKGVLVVDSWSTFTVDNIMKCVPEGVELRVQQIPPHRVQL
ncbi:hypothetical protein FOCC_FOCC005294, partial [Frankliniella occidentalis]